MLATEQQFLNVIRQSSWEDVEYNYLVFADWLEEQGEQERVDSIRWFFQHYLDKWLEEVNGKRRTRILSKTAILQQIRDIAGRDDIYSYKSGGSSHYHRWPSFSTVSVVSQREDGRLCVGIGRANGYAPSPACIHNSLGYLSVCGPERACERLDIWGNSGSAYCL